MRTVVLLGAVVAVAAGALTAGAAAEPTRGSHACVRGNELWFRAADRTRLVGHRFGGRRPGRSTTVVLAHMSDGDLCQWVPYARSLAAMGYFAFPFDFRSRGHSQYRPGDTSGRLAGDVAAAVKVVRRLGARRVVVAGASLGGIASLVAAANIRPPVAGVISVSSPAAYNRLDATRWVPKLRVPVLYLAAESDRSKRYDFAADARRLHALTRAPTKRLEIVSGSRHGVFMLESADVRRLVDEFLRSR